MVYFSQVVTNHIMWAANEQEVMEVIDSSIDHYKSKQVRHYVESYIMNMVVELENLKRKKEMSTKVLENVNIAIERLKDLSTQGYGYVL